MSTKGFEMQVAVMGAGAVGSYFGGMLARAGHTVTLIARPAHVEAIARDGLRIESARFDERIRLGASSDPAAAAVAALVLVCVKSADSEAAAMQLLPHIDPQATVLSLQNGVDNAERLARALGRPVQPAVVYVATEMAGPGHVLHRGRGELVIGPSAGAEALASLFGSAGVPIEISSNVSGMLWTKLVLNCAYNALSAITRLPYGEVVRGPGVWDTMRDIVAECQAVATAEGVVLPDDPWPLVERLVQSMPAQFSSTAQDLMRGKPTEVDYLNGHIVRCGARHRIATPVNRSLWALVKLLEARPQLR